MDLCSAQAPADGEEAVTACLVSKEAEWSRASVQPQRLRGAFKVVHLRPQITQPRDRFASQWTRVYRQFLHCLGSYVSDNSALWCSPRHVLQFLYSLSQKHRKHVYMHLRWHSTLCVTYVCTFGQQVHGTGYSIYHVAM